MQQHILRIYLALFFVSGFALSAAAQHKLGHLDSFAAGQVSVASESQGNAATLAEAPMQMEAPGLDEIAITVRGNQIRVQHAEGLYGQCRSWHLYRQSGQSGTPHYYRLKRHSALRPMHSQNTLYIVFVFYANSQHKRSFLP